jgi:hypothetical protein
VGATGRAPRLLGWTIFVLYFEWMIIAMSYGKVDHDRFAFLVALAVLPTVAPWGSPWRIRGVGGPPGEPLGVGPGIRIARPTSAPAGRCGSCRSPSSPPISSRVVETALRRSGLDDRIGAGAGDPARGTDLPTHRARPRLLIAAQVGIMTSR